MLVTFKVKTKLDHYVGKDLRDRHTQIAYKYAIFDVNDGTLFLDFGGFHQNYTQQKEETPSKPIYNLRVMIKDVAPHLKEKNNIIKSKDVVKL